MKKVKISKSLMESLSDMIHLEVAKNRINENTETITASEAASLIENSKGALFTVTFIKNDKTERVLNGRLGVKKHLKGGNLPYDPKDHDLIPLYDMQAEVGKGYRMLNKNRITALRINGKNYIIK